MQEKLLTKPFMEENKDIHSYHFTYPIGVAIETMRQQQQKEH